MDFSRSIRSANRSFWCALLAVLVGVSVAQAYPWSSEPQPLLHNAQPIVADAGSPLAWDQSWQILWFVESGDLCAAWWTGRTFDTCDMKLVSPSMEAGFVVDSSYHALYCLDASGRLQSVHAVGSKWVISRIGNEPLTRLLGLDAGQHWVFAYDAAVGGIRCYGYDGRAKAWKSTIVATGLGNAGDTAAVDGVWHILYSTHETAAASVPRRPGLHAINDPTGLGKFKPWPLVATALSGTTWTSRVLDETGVPQQPAVRATDHRVFYAQHDETDLVHYYQPKFGKLAESFGSSSGWSGQDTYEDNDSYTILKPQVPQSWNYGAHSVISRVGGFGSGVTMTTRFPQISTEIRLQGPITVIPYYEPVWTDVALPPRLTSFRAVVNPAQGRLVQHCERFSGELVRQQTGARVAGYLYRDANGVLVTNGGSMPAYSGRTYAYTTGSSAPTPVSYSQLGADFDPANPPASFAALTDANASFYVLPDNIVADPTHRFTAKSQAVHSNSSLDPQAPFVAAQLRLPTQVDLHTFGHRYLTTTLNQPGGRYRNYSKYGTGYAVPSAIAVDNSTGVTFYTQTPPPASDENSTPATSDSAAPLSGFYPVPDPKLPRPTGVSVWIVMVY